MPNFIEIQNAITLAKKYNVAIRAVKENRGDIVWDENKLSNLIRDFNINFNNNDKENFKRKRSALISDFRKLNLQSLVLDYIDALFNFEEKSDINNKQKYVPTKESAEVLNLSAELVSLMLKVFDISTSQIRRYLDGLRKVKVSVKTPSDFIGSSVILQQVKVAYAAGRDSDLMFFYEIMKELLKKGSESYHYFEQALRFVEAIVAYHKFYKGED